MINIKSKKTKQLAKFTFLGIIMWSILITSVTASINYQNSLEKGTEIFIVNQYYDSAWKTTVNNSTSPSNWFEGEANVTGAKSKLTVKGWNQNLWTAYDSFISLFISEYYNFNDRLTLLGILNFAGYNETTINANYTNTYHLWYGLRAVWNFTSGEFNELPSYTEGISIFRNPSDLKLILDDYNNLATKLNGNFFVHVFNGYTFPILNADEFLWQLVLNGFAIATPQQEYLVNLITGLGCENASSSGNTLTIERSGETDYTVEISYGEQGTISTFTVKDAGDAVVFQILSKNSEWIFYIILIVIAVCVAALVAYIIIKKRKPKR
ncbi:MAG: hypothetical protein ACFFBI_14830 [Promethearchaeota archaeon]